MTCIKDVKPTFGIKDVLRMQGIKGASGSTQEFVALSKELLDSVYRLSFLKTAIAYEFIPVVKIKQDRIFLKGGNFLRGDLFLKRLYNALEVALIVCTIGPQLEKKVTDYFSRGERLRAILLDGIGSAAVEALAQEACQIIRDRATSRTYESSSPFTPGMHKFPLSEQWTLCRIVNADQIGVHLTRTGMMVPRKSTSIVVGIGGRMPTWTKAKSCAMCGVKHTCRYRVNA